MTKKSKSPKANKKQVISGISNEKLCSLLSYVLLGLLWYLLDEKIRKPEVKFHVKQGLVLFLAELINSAVWSIPIIGWVVGPIINLGILILVIIGIVNVLNDKTQPIPLIGKFAENFKF